MQCNSDSNRLMESLHADLHSQCMNSGSSEIHKNMLKTPCTEHEFYPNITICMNRYHRYRHEAVIWCPARTHAYIHTHIRSQSVHSVLFLFSRKEREDVGILLMPPLHPAAASLLPFLLCLSSAPFPLFISLQVFLSFDFSVYFTHSSHFSCYWLLTCYVTPIFHHLSSCFFSCFLLPVTLYIPGDYYFQYEWYAAIMIILSLFIAQCTTHCTCWC